MNWARRCAVGRICYGSFKFSDSSEYMCYTTEESEKMKVIDLAEELGGDMQEAIRRLSGNKERKS